MFVLQTVCLYCSWDALLPGADTVTSLPRCAGGDTCSHFVTVMCLAQGTKVNSKGKEVPHGTRLYSIAATRYGDTFDGKTTSLCVRRAEYWDPELKANDPAKKGICSNFLCDAKPGDEITMTGVQPSQPTTMWPSLPPWAINLVECSQYLMGVQMR